MSWLKQKHFWLLAPIAIIVLLDEWIKWYAMHNLPSEESIVGSPLLDFAVHKNFGIAFDIPFKQPFIIVISILIGYFLFKTAVANFHKRPAVSFSSIVIILGAAGNLFDRIAYGFTVDYIFILGRSAFNLSDAVIVLGVVGFLMSSRRNRRKRKNKIEPEHSID